MLDLVQNLNFLKMGNPSEVIQDRAQLLGLRVFLERYVRLYRRELGNLFSSVPLRNVHTDEFDVAPLRDASISILKTSHNCLHCWNLRNCGKF